MRSGTKKKTILTTAWVVAEVQVDPVRGKVIARLNDIIAGKDAGGGCVGGGRSSRLRLLLQVLGTGLRVKLREAL